MRRSHIPLSIILFLFINTNFILAFKILVPTTYFPAKEGRFIVNLIIGLIDAGHDVTIFAGAKGPAVFHPVIKKYRLLERVIYKKIPHNLDIYDVIVCQFGYTGVTFAELLKTIPQDKRPIFATCFRGADISRSVKKNKNMYDLLFKIGNIFLPVCNDFKERLITLGCPAKKITVLHSGIDCDAFYFAPKKLQSHEQIILTSVSRLVEKKGLEYVIAAVAELKKKYPRLQYWIVGEGMLREKLVALVAEYNLQETVFFLGRQQEEDVIDILHKSHIFILPSITAKDGDKEGIPNALKEAMASGVPVIATDHAGNKELILNNMGILIAEKDVDQLVKSIDVIIQNYNSKTMKEQLFRARNHIVDNFGMTTTNAQLISIINNSMQRN